MSPLDRLLVASAVLVLGGLVGFLLRRALSPAGGGPSEPTGLSAGLIVVTAPYCTRCTSLQSRLDQAGIRYSRLDAASSSSRLRDLGITTAPTLLCIDASGRVLQREARDFSDERLSELAAPPA